MRIYSLDKFLSLYQYLRQNKVGLFGYSRFAKTDRNREAHARDSSTFTKHCASCFSDHFATNESCNLWHVNQPWTDHDVGNIPLDRKRWKLPDHPALVSYAHALVANPVDLLYEPLTETGS